MAEQWNQITIRLSIVFIISVPSWYICYYLVPTADVCTGLVLWWIASLSDKCRTYITEQTFDNTSSGIG